MPKKVKEVEQDIDLVQKEVKKTTFATRWFDENAVNNKEDLKIICNLTARSAEEQFCLYLKSGNTEVYAVVFYVTFITICDFIKKQQSKRNNFTIQIGNSINIGYTNNDDENNEKVGNFMPILEHISINRTIVDDNDSIDPDKTTQNCLRWKELNLKQNIQYYKEIQEKAYETLQREYKTSLRTSEAVIPLFCIFMDNVTEYVKIKFQELKDTDISETSMNVLGLFDIYYEFDPEDDTEKWTLNPNITTKVALKDDNAASRES